MIRSDHSTALLAFHKLSEAGRSRVRDSKGMRGDVLKMVAVSRSVRSTRKVTRRHVSIWTQDFQASVRAGLVRPRGWVRIVWEILVGSWSWRSIWTRAAWKVCERSRSFEWEERVGSWIKAKRDGAHSRCSSRWNNPKSWYSSRLCTLANLFPKVLPGLLKPLKSSSHIISRLPRKEMEKTTANLRRKILFSTNISSENCSPWGSKAAPVTVRAKAV